MQFESESYLKTGSNELRILEYRVAGKCFGINILKVQKIVAQPECLTSTLSSRPFIAGMFRDNGSIIPLIDLAQFLGFDRRTGNEIFGKIIVTEFFGILNAFRVDSVEWIHHFHWQDVIDAASVMKTIEQKYIIGIVKPDGERLVPMLDYESIILDICPELGLRERSRVKTENYVGQGKKILIAEDSPSVRNMLAAELTDLGFDVVLAGDGTQAWDKLKTENDIDLLVSDVEMPRMDGLALTCAIRNDATLKDLPVIVYSSIGDAGMKNRVEFLKANAHITKLSFEELFDSICRMVRYGKATTVDATVS